MSTAVIPSPVELRPLAQTPLPRICQIFDLLVAVSSPALAIRPELLAGIDWDILLTRARHHSLVPLLAHRLLESGRELALARDIRERLRAEFQSNLVRNFGLLEEARRILAAWQRHGIEAMPYKGPALAEQLWGSFALRECSDLDFLVRRGDVYRAGAVLQQLKYANEISVPEWLRPALLRNASEEQFRHPESQILVELQWAPVPRTLAVNYDEQLLWKNRTSTPLAGSTVSAPSPEDLLGLLVIHGWKHNWSKLIWIADVAVLIERYELDWQRIYESARRGGWRRILLLGLEMVRRIYAVEPAGSALPRPDLRIGELAQDLERNLRSAGNRSYLAWHRDMLRARDSRPHQARQMLNFISTPGLAEYTECKLPAWSALGYRLVRLARVAGLMSAKARE